MLQRLPDPSLSVGLPAECSLSRMKMFNDWKPKQDILIAAVNLADRSKEAVHALWAAMFPFCAG